MDINIEQLSIIADGWQHKICHYFLDSLCFVKKSPKFATKTIMFMAGQSVEKTILETVKRPDVKMVPRRMEPFVRQKCLEL